MVSTYLRPINVVNRNRITSFLGFIESPPSFATLYGSIWRFIAIPPQSLSASPSAEERVVINSMKSFFEDGFFKRNFYFICSSNALLCCYRNAPIGHAKKPHSLVTNYHILNPLSKICYRLPLSPKQQQACNQWQPRSGMEEPYMKPSIGLVASYKYDTYKVVRVEAILLQGSTRMVEIETFSSDTGEWELSTVSVSPHIHKNFLELQKVRHEVTVIKGVIHWMHWRTFDCVITYDPNSRHEHGLSMIRPPPPPTVFYKYVYMGESTDGLLQLVKVRTFHHFVSMDVWVFRSINGCQKWSLRYRTRQLPPRYTPQTLVGFHPHKTNTLLMEINGCIFVYHLNNNLTTTATPPTQVMKPFLQLPHSPIFLVLQPYTLPPWHISPLPLQKRTAC